MKPFRINEWIQKKVYLNKWEACELWQRKKPIYEYIAENVKTENYRKILL